MKEEGKAGGLGSRNRGETAAEKGGGRKLCRM